MGSMLENCESQVKNAGTVVYECEEETIICPVGTEGEQGGFKIMGNGGSAGKREMRYNCFPESKIKEEAEKILE